MVFCVADQSFNARCPRTHTPPLVDRRAARHPAKSMNVHVHPDRLPNTLPRKTTRGSRAPEEVSSEPEEGSPVLARGGWHPPATLLCRVRQVWSTQTEVVGPGSKRAELAGFCRPQGLRVSWRCEPPLEPWERYLPRAAERRHQVSQELLGVTGVCLVQQR
eukprot:15470643-Alexandrium_andersonii.AAC.1